MSVVESASLKTAFVSGDGEMAARIRAHDWGATPLGNIEAWPWALKTAVDIMLGSPGPVALLWGPERVQLYNDSYVPIAAERHPLALGGAAAENWSEAYEDFLGPIFDRVFAGEVITLQEHAVRLRAPGGEVEERYFTGSFQPVRDETGGVAGIFHPLVEVTGRKNVEDELRRSEARYHQLFDSLQSGFCIVEVDLSVTDGPIDYRVVEANPAFYEQTGFPETILGRWLREAAPELEEHWYQLYGRVARTGIPERSEQGSEALGRWFEVYAFCTGKPQERRVAILFNDISARRSAEIALQESEARFRNMADHAPVMMWITDSAGVCTYLNRRWYEFTGQVEGEGEGYGWLNAVHPEDRPAAEQAFVSANAQQHDYRVDFRLRRADGVFRWTIDAAAARFGPTGEYLGYVGSVIDIDDRREIEDALRESEERLRLAVDNAEIGFWDVDVVNDVLIWPPRTKAMFGISASTPVSMTDFFEGLHPDDRPATGAAYAAAADPVKRAIYDVEYRTVGKEDGVVRWVAAKGRGLFDRPGPQARCLRVIGTAIDITARKATEAKLRQLNETLERRVSEALAERKLLADLVEGTDAFVQVADLQFRWLALNKAAADEYERIYGVRPVVGQSMLDMLDHLPDHREAVRAVWSRALAGEEFTEVGEFGDPGRERRSYEMKYNVLRDSEGRALGAYQFVYDVTQRVQEQRRLAEAEDALRQSQKMEAMGQLTGGVAHDFNNLLTPIIGSLDMLVRKGLGNERERRLIDGALQSAERAKTLVQRLLAFARRQPLQPGPVDVKHLVRGMADLIASTSGPHIDVQVQLPEDLPPAIADANQLEMAVLNLAVNARDAMPSGGVLTISAARESVRSEHRSKLRRGHYVRLSVTDTGVGMDEATRARAIEPFFSTKGIGKGTGLGLSMVHGLALQLNGELTIASLPDQGTSIDLWLPISSAVEEADTGAVQAASVPERLGTALLVDDEDLVRMSTADMLMDLGYEVVEAGSAEEALRLLGDGLVPDLLVTDHLMPGMSGAELARQLRENRPDLPVLIVSGYAEVEGIEPGLPRLAKPFRKADLAASLVPALSAREGGAPLNDT